jgi:hypothetical protein
LPNSIACAVFRPSSGASGVRWSCATPTIHPGNLLVGEDGQLCLLDWDDARLAPPEHDLWSGLGRRLNGESFAVFLDAYLRAGGVAALHMERFAFYLLRRFVEDMASCLHTLLEDDADERNNDLWLYGMQAWGFNRWSNLDQTLATIETSLQVVSG